MDINQALESIADRLQTTGVRTVYGQPVDVQGRTIIPVARMAYGFGCGGGSETGGDTSPDRRRDEGGGGGGGARAVPVGVVEITAEHTRFILLSPWRSRAALAIASFGLGVVTTWWAVFRKRRTDRRGRLSAGSPW